MAVTSGPWLLTTMVLVLLRVSAMRGGAPGVAAAESVVTLVYAVSIVVGAPIDIVLSRYASDRVYEARRDQIAAPLRRALAGGLVAFTAVGAAAMLLLGPPAALAVPGVFLATIVGTQWLLLSAAGGLSSPGIILRAFALGAPVSVLGAIGLSGSDALGAAGYLYGYGAGQIVTLALLLAGTFAALPPEEDEGARFAPALREYALLGAAAFAFQAGIWIDKLVVWLVAGSHMAALYVSTAAVAWLSVVPACAHLFVAVETAFHRRFHAFYAALRHDASLDELDRLARDLRAEVGRTLRGTAGVQAAATIVCLLLAPTIVARLGLSELGAGTFVWLLLGAAAQVVALAATLLLHYFDHRREAFAVGVTQLVLGGALTALLGAPSPLLGAGYCAACVLASAAAIVLLGRRTTRLVERTFQSQPYPTEA